MLLYTDVLTGDEMISDAYDVSPRLFALAIGVS